MGTQATAVQTAARSDELAATPLRAQFRSNDKSRSNDPYEIEAEELAEWLARHDADTSSRPVAPPPIRAVNPLSNDWGHPIPKAFLRSVKQSAGRPVPPSLRENIESATETDLSGVSLHDGPSAQAATRLLCAQAVTVGSDIYFSKHLGGDTASRRLVAHEIVHTIQQGAVARATHDATPDARAKRFQASFERTPAELNPKVTRLINLHLADFPEVKNALESADADDESIHHWWPELRENFEDTGASTLTETERRERALTPDLPGYGTPDLNQATDDAINTIGDYEGGGGLKNDLAGLLADYLKINDVPEQAAKVILKFPYSMTAIAKREVYDELDSDVATFEGRPIRHFLRSGTVEILPTLWDIFKPESATEATWTGEIVEIFEEFFNLPPLSDYMERRQELSAKLSEDIRPVPVFPESETDTAFEQLDDTSTLGYNELYEAGAEALNLVRSSLSGSLRGFNLLTPERTGHSPLELWRRTPQAMARTLVRLRGDQSDHGFSDPIKAIVLQAAGREVADALRPTVNRHVEFWRENAGRATSTSTASETNSRLRNRLGERTYAELFMTEESRSLVRTIADLAPTIAGAFIDYFDLSADDDSDSGEASPLTLLIQRHAARIGPLVTILQNSVLPQITERIYQARQDESAVRSLQRLTWFGARLLNMIARLRDLPAEAAFSPEEPARADPGALAALAEARIRHIEQRESVARLVNEIAAAALETEVTPPTQPGDDPAITHGFRSALARPYERMFEASLHVITREDIGMSILILRHPYERSPNAPISQIIDDASESGPMRPIEEIEPLNARDLYLFYDAFYFDELAEVLNELGDAAEESGADRQIEGDDWALFSQGRRNLRERIGPDALPHRYTSQDIFWRPISGENNSANFSRYLEADPLFIHFSNNLEAQHPHVYKDQYAPDGERLWAWSLPDISGLRELLENYYQSGFLRGINGIPQNRFDNLTDLTADELEDDIRRGTHYARIIEIAPDFAGEAHPDGPPEGYDNWLSRLRERSRRMARVLGENPMTSDEVAANRDDRRTTLRERREAAINRADHAKRRATTIDRHLFERDIAELFEEDATDPVNIRQILDLLQLFRSAVRPAHDREIELQVTALVLANAAEIVELANDRPLGLSKGDLYPFLSMAAKRLDLPIDDPRGLGAANAVHDDPDTAEDESAAVPIDSHSEGIFSGGTLALATAVAAHRQNIIDAKDALRNDLESPLQWQLGITGWNTDSVTTPSAAEGEPSSTVGRLKSHLSEAFPVYTFASIRARNEQLDEDESEPTAIMIDPGGLSIRILRVVQPFTFLPGVGDYRGATATEGGEHAYYVPGKVYIGIPATSPDGLPDEAHVTEVPRGEPVISDDAPANLNLVEIQALLGDREISRFMITADDLGGPRGGLNWLSGIIHAKSNSEGLENLGNIIEAYGEGLLFVASLYPPAGLAITAAEVLGFIARLQTDDEFLEAITAVWEDPEDVILDTINAVTNQFTASNLFDLLMNGNFEPDAFVGDTSRSRNGRRIGGSRFAAVMRRLRMVAAAIAFRLEAFQESVQGPVRGVEEKLATHPRISNFTHWIGDNADAFDDPVGRALRHPILGRIIQAYIALRRYGETAEDAIQGIADIGDPLPEIADNIQESLDRMVDFELPDTIIPLEMAIEALVEVALGAARRFGSKGKIVWLLGNIIREGADATGVSDVLYGELADMLEDSPGDPNVYWREEAVPMLNPPMKEAIRETAGTLRHYLSEAPLIGDYFGNDRTGGTALPENHTAPPPSGDHAENAEAQTAAELDSVFDSERVNELTPEGDEAPPVTGVSYSTISSLPQAFFDNMTEPEGDDPPPEPTTPSSDTPDMPEGSPAPSSAPPGDPPRRSSPGANGGSPLPASTRGDAERSFGHDFSHVRLHRGDGAWAATSGRGADAVTSGSHVWLRPDLDPNSGRGRKVMRHEFAHVLQKTGPRPLGERQSGSDASPKSPESGDRLRWNPSEESAADRMASRANRNRSGHPIPVEGRHRDGFSPSITTDMMEMFFKKISSPASGDSLADTVERAHRGGRSAQASANTRTAAGKLWTALKSKIDDGLDADGPFDDAALQSDIKNHIRRFIRPLYRTSGNTPSVREMISHLAARREEDPERPSGRRSGRGRRSRSTSGDEAEPTFDARGFLNDLSLYIAARTGVVIDLNLTSDTVAENLASEAQSVSGSLIAENLSARIEHIELLFVSHTATEGKEIWKATVANTWNLRDRDEIETHRQKLRDVLIFEFGAEPTNTGENASEDGSGDDGGEGSFTTLWKSTSPLQLNRSYKRRVEAALNPVTIGASVMPNYEYFADPENNSLEGDFDDRDRVRKNAIHYGTHGQFRTPGAYHLSNNERNSHHIVQYLLAEYFRNKKTEQPFPERVPYPGGIATGGGDVDSVTAGSETIQIKNTEEGSYRGNAMPAILLSAHSHHNSGLHVTPVADDDGQASQGYAIHRIFEEKLVARTRTDNWTEAQTYLKANASDPTAANRLYRAIQDTAEWIWLDAMKSNLQEDMPNKEAEFYTRQFSSVEESERPNFNAVKSAITARVSDSVLHAKLQPLRDLGWSVPIS